jgi:chitinase
MEARRRLSFIRLLILAGAIMGLAFGGWTQGSEAYQRITAKPSSTWFAPYDDVTLTPVYHFEDPIVSPSLTQMLGFVVANPKNACSPTWGTYYDMDGAGRALDLDRRIVRLRERGGDAVISFGGAANADLAGRSR